MDDLKYCTLYNKYNDDCDISEISKAFIYLHNEGLVLTNKGEVFRVNNTGFIKLEVFSNKKVIDFASATTIQLSVLVFVLTEYEIYGWGPNGYRQVSNNNVNHVPDPQKIAMPSPGLFSWYKFTNISCVYGHCMALTSDNCLILWGSNSHGQIGNGSTKSTETPYRVKFRKRLLGNKTEFPDKRIVESTSKIISIACSARNSYVLLENGEVYGWGENRTGQMGTLHGENYTKPHLIYSRMKQFMAINSHALALRHDGVLFGNGNNKFAQIGDLSVIGFYDKPFRFAAKFEKFVIWRNLSMGLTSDGKCFIWGQYGPVVFASVRLKITIDKRKVDKSTQVNFFEERAESFRRGSKRNLIALSKSKQKVSEETDNFSYDDEMYAKSKDTRDNSLIDSAISVETIMSRLDDFQEEKIEDFVPNDDNYLNEKKIDENNQQESFAAANTSNNNGDKNNTDNKDIETVEKELEEKRKIREIIEKGEIEFHMMDLKLKRPTEIKCRSFSKIIAKRFDELYITANTDLSNGYRNDNYAENDLIDLSDFIVVIYEYQEIVEQKVDAVAKTADKKENEKGNEIYKKLEERLVKVEQSKSKIVQNYNFGTTNKTKTALFNKSTISKVEEFDVSDINLTGCAAAADAVAAGPSNV